MSVPSERTGVTPASLSFLAIYNPSLSESDESLHDQIVYYFSRAEVPRKRSSVTHDTEKSEGRDKENERLRQVGLAQGMVEFAKYALSERLEDAVKAQLYH